MASQPQMTASKPTPQSAGEQDAELAQRICTLPDTYPSCDMTNKEREATKLISQARAADRRQIARLEQSEINLAGKLDEAKQEIAEFRNTLNMVLTSEGKGLLLELKQHQINLARAKAVIEACEKVLVCNPTWPAFLEDAPCGDCAQCKALTLIKQFKGDGNNL
jgi:hypothetical protein